jgi:hypothetical protein
MMDCIICLSPPHIKQTFDLHHVVYLIQIYLNHIPNSGIYTNPEAMRPWSEKEKIDLDKEEYNDQAKLDMNQDLNIPDGVFSLP